VSSIVLKNRIDQPPRETHLFGGSNLSMEDGQVPTYGHVPIDINVLVIGDMASSMYVHVVTKAHVSSDVKILPPTNVSVPGHISRDHPIQGLSHARVQRVPQVPSTL
jgi:hypothetical protein